MMQKALLICLVALAAIAAGEGLAQAAGDRVVARVGDDKITLADVQAATPRGATSPAAQKAVLQALVGRRLLVQEALRQKLDRTPIGAMVMSRARENAIAQVLERHLAGTPPTISDDQARAFVAANPLMFPGRRLLTLNQFLTDQGGPDLIKKLQPANDMATFEQTLIQNGVSYRRAATVVDTLKLNGKIAAQIVKMKPGDVFITPRGTGLELSDVIDNGAAPITGGQAEAVARALLVRQAINQKVGSEVGKIIKAGQPDVQINDAYMPKPKK